MKVKVVCTRCRSTNEAQIPKGNVTTIKIFGAQIRHHCPVCNEKTTHMLKMNRKEVKAGDYLI